MFTYSLMYFWLCACAWLNLRLGPHILASVICCLVMMIAPKSRTRKGGKERVELKRKYGKKNLGSNRDYW